MALSNMWYFVGLKHGKIFTFIFVALNILLSIYYSWSYFRGLGVIVGLLGLITSLCCMIGLCVVTLKLKHLILDNFLRYKNYFQKKFNLMFPFLCQKSIEFFVLLAVLIFYVVEILKVNQSIEFTYSLFLFVVGCIHLAGVYAYMFLCTYSQYKLMKEAENIEAIRGYLEQRVHQQKTNGDN